ncbi:hypothetical protein [Lactococcus formosensis]|jgi:anti-repressor protein|uniref:Bro-N domain-containing protein n=1 Tax=Lactococcus formosensis TaxID=1281486 RepID=A0A9Q8Y0T6_9LACT|nr:hypothetical protein [Lactococcus formosensis]MDG6110947.1 hypothetical protein [Lactococcus formosensis]MDG6117445.1 hypothetical protein [Lactococcus formosensis]MDG6126001.1 hypothetical protein [Lactococcus formosensis]MDG6130864.1 hypothetical protein [Lactococcus formosensis]MDG6153921.1 hypothetical protein [Lactococcus formosensis]
MSELQNFTNGIFDLDIKVESEKVLFSAEQVAKTLGLTTIAKSGNEVVRWSRVSKYLSQQVGKTE